MKTRRWIVMLSCIFTPALSLRAEEHGKTLELLTWTSSVYVEQRECFSCHHQTLPSLALRQAHRDGYEVDLEEIKHQTEHTHRFFEKRKEKISKGDGVPGGPFTAGYALLLLKDNDWPADETTEAMAQYLQQKQQPDGRWKIGTKRPPMEYSDFTATALAVRGLQLYPPTSDDDEQEKDASIDSNVEKARQWLIDTPAKHQEDRTFRLLGLVWTQADRGEIEKAVRDIFAQQRDDGGWAQETGMESDAYATGQILVALLKAGAWKEHPDAIGRGIEFLRRTRLEDGSWFVQTHSKPIQVYFESGFPHEKSQFISAAATSWAVWAMLLYEAEAKPK